MLVMIGFPLIVWARLEVRGVEELQAPGAILLVSNHDSALDPLALGAAGMMARRPVRFLTRSNLWRLRPLGVLLDSIRQIPIRRGAGDTAALQVATSALRAGEVVCVFPEGTISRGQWLRARRGISRLAESYPDARVVLAAVSGGTDLVRFPRRPRVLVELFAPHSGQPAPGEDHAALAARLLAEIRGRVPPVAAGRRVGGSRRVLRQARRHASAQIAAQPAASTRAAAPGD
jgi:1-acyl-sn-glycerol-3-phosphate acyltransferase